MPVFEYKGLNKAGKNVKGIVDADSQRTARMKLKKDGIFVKSLSDKSKAQKKKKSVSAGTKGKASIDDISNMTRQLSSLVRANIPLVDCLGAVSDQMENAYLKEVLADCRNQVNEGSTLEKAMAKYPNVFDNIFISMVGAGEMSGSLDVILLRLAEFAEARSELKSRVQSAMMYPIITILLMLAILMAMFVYVLPTITNILVDQGVQIPWYTQLVMDISGFMVNYWLLIIIGSLIAVAIFIRWKSSPSGRPIWDRITLKIPVVGKLARMIAVSRFTRTLSTLLSGGVPMLNALDIVRSVVDNEVLAKAIDQARDNIREGESIAVPLKKSGHFPPIVIHMVSIGEKTGELEKMLNQVADTYDFQVKNQVDGLTALMTPVMLILMGGVIGFIVIAVLVPMMDMMNVVQ
ncbi:MAG: type II secretion system inner membrane protein GspF [Bdellovibrionaceae bacterium]|nr:type II secretion system inner membrane protein GspF [Pseudobdellovibrionaceae bacterium]